MSTRQTRVGEEGERAAGRTRLQDLSASVADSEPVDWDELSQEPFCADDPELAATVRHLRTIAAVAAAHRGLEPVQEPAAARETLFTWGHLQVVEKLGEGSFGEVFRAYDEVLDREVALKLRRMGPSEVAGSGRRFITEARLLAKVRHANVLEVYGADLHDGRVGLWTELVRGRTLAQWVEEEGPRGPLEAAAVGLDLCRALAAVHAAGLVHGDVKAGNVIREHGGRIVLADLGSAVRLDEQGPVSVSPFCAAPEVLQGAPLRTTADLYSLAVLLYHLVSGAYPIEGGQLSAIVEHHQCSRLRPLRDRRPDLPPELVAVVERGMAAAPEERFQTAGEMEQALNAVLSGQGAASRRSAEAGAAPRRRRWSQAVLGLAMVASVAVVGLLVVRPWARPHPVAPAATASEHAAADEADRPVVPEEPQEEARTGESETPAVAVAAPGGSPIASSTMYRMGVDGRQPLDSGATVVAGDQLSLDVDAGQDTYLYVVNGDQEGGLFLLFPLPGLDQGNPLPAGRHRLPGSVEGVDQDWQVTSAGGVESFLLVASGSPLAWLEQELAAVDAASAGRAVDTGSRITLRGVGGLVETRHEGDNPRLQRLVGLLRDRRQLGDALWLTRIDLRSTAP